MKSHPAIPWLIEAGSPPVRYRTLRNILGRRPDEETRQAVLAYEPARDVAARQREDGTWGGRLHTGDSRGDVRQTTEIQWPRLVEYGWEPGNAAVDRGVSLLLGLLADDAPGYYDLATYMRGPRRTRYMIWFCRSIAASLLAHAGLGGLEPVAGVTRALVAACHRFVTGPAAAEPAAGSPPVIRPEAYDEELGYPAIPDLYLLQLFAHSPAARSDPRLPPVLDYLFGPDYRRLDQGIGLVALEGRPFVKGWKVELPGADAMLDRGMWAYGLTVLELVARLGAVGRCPAAGDWLRWLAQRQVSPGIYDLPASAFSRHGPFAERVRLAPGWRVRTDRVADITFRVQLIQRLLESEAGCP